MLGVMSGMAGARTVSGLTPALRQRLLEEWATGVEPSDVVGLPDYCAGPGPYRSPGPRCAVVTTVSTTASCAPASADRPVRGRRLPPVRSRLCGCSRFRPCTTAA